MNVLKSRERKPLLKAICEAYGCSDIFSEFTVFKTSKEEKIWIAPKEVFDMNVERLRPQSVGLYVGRIDRGVVRPSIEGAQIIGKTATKNIAEIDKERLWDFLRGFDVEASKLIDAKENGYVLVKYNTDILGVSKLIGNTLQNVLPKSRKLTSLAKEKDLYED
jgi:NOL1/NOP2/fmu family ribosome biogenesis protein